MIIVSRHAGAVAWLRQRGIHGRVIEHATIEQIAGQHIVGNLPLHLAAQTASVTAIEMDVPPEMRGIDLTPGQMDECGAVLRRYVVQEVPVPEAGMEVGQEIIDGVTVPSISWIDSAGNRHWNGGTLVSGSRSKAAALITALGGRRSQMGVTDPGSGESGILHWELSSGGGQVRFRYV